MIAPSPAVHTRVVYTANNFEKKEWQQLLRTKSNSQEWNGLDPPLFSNSPGVSKLCVCQMKKPVFMFAMLFIYAFKYQINSYIGTQLIICTGGTCIHKIHFVNILSI